MARFPDTHWSLIRQSGENPTARHAAFSRLAHEYRPAILAFFRSHLPVADAEDAAQSFLAASFEHHWWARADAQAGSFRGFLLMLLHRHLGHVCAAQRPTQPLDEADEPLDLMPDAQHQFDVRFALLLTAQALDGLRMRYRERGREVLFGPLVTLLGAPPEHGQLQQIALELGLAPNTLTVEIKRLRSRLRDGVRESLRQLCADDAAFENEWTTLRSVLEGR